MAVEGSGRVRPTGTEYARLLLVSCSVYRTAPTSFSILYHFFQLLKWIPVFSFDVPRLYFACSLQALSVLHHYPTTPNPPPSPTRCNERRSTQTGRTAYLAEERRIPPTIIKIILCILECQEAK